MFCAVPLCIFAWCGNLNSVMPAISMEFCLYYTVVGETMVVAEGDYAIWIDMLPDKFYHFCEKETFLPFSAMPIP